MRAMRKIIFAFALLVAGCGSNSSMHDMAMSIDMSIGPDMAMRVPNGVVCGNMTCAVGQECCATVANNMVTGASCMATGGNCANAFTCDGPEDCTKPTDQCCGTIDLNVGGNADAGITLAGGSSTCGACTASISLGGAVMTRMCHSATDCMGFSTAVLGQTIAFDKCCTGGGKSLQFCAPDPSVISGFTGTAPGYTCQ
jgi:hypothetical protein